MRLVWAIGSALYREGIHYSVEKDVNIEFFNLAVKLYSNPVYGY